MQEQERTGPRRLPNNVIFSVQATTVLWPDIAMLICISTLKNVNIYTKCVTSLSFLFLILKNTQFGN